MTRPANSDTESIKLPGEGGLSRRELRKQRLIEEAAAGIITPTSIFDLEFTPRPRKYSTESPAEPEAEAEADALETQVEAPELAPEPEPMPAEPIATPAPANISAPTPAPKPASRPRTQPSAPKITPLPASAAAATGSSLLFERIPAPPAEAAVLKPPLAQAEPAEVEQPPAKRAKRFTAIAAGAAVFGFVLTLTLPALSPSAESYSSAAEGQKLVSGDAVGSQIDFESFESVDELESAAEAAMLRADTFVNDTSSSVQYPFDVGVPLTDGFGPRMFPVSGFHDAQDFAPGYGAPVRSIADGSVIESGPTSDGCGFGLKIKHRIEGQDVESRYCHLAAAPLVGLGDKVRVGQFVALVGATGIAFGPHLHMVIQVDGKAVDPMPFFAKYNKITSGALTKKSAASTPTASALQTTKN